MKNTDTTFDENIILSYYGELSDTEQQRLDAACADDESLRQRSMLFRESFERVKLATDEDVDERMLQRLELSILNSTVGAEKVNAVGVRKPNTSFWSSFKELFLTPQRIGFTLAGGLAFMLVGVFVGSQLQMGPTQQGASMTATGTSPGAEDAAVVAASEKVSDFLKRSQIYFATSVDREVLCEKCLPIQQQLPNRKIAQDLLQEASALRKQSAANPEIQKLITDIEFVLDNIGNNSQINAAQAEVVHHIASNAVCEVAARIDSVKLHHQNQLANPK